MQNDSDNKTVADQFLLVNRKFAELYDFTTFQLAERINQLFGEISLVSKEINVKDFQLLLEKCFALSRTIIEVHHRWQVETKADEKP